MTATKPTPAEVLATKLSTHLRRLEKNQTTDQSSRFYFASAQAWGKKVKVIYVSYQGQSTLTLEEAELYLQALDGGYRGKHFGVPEIQAVTKARADQVKLAWDTQFAAEQRVSKIARRQSDIRGEVFDLAMTLGLDDGVGGLRSVAEIAEKCQEYRDLSTAHFEALKALNDLKGKK